MKAAAIILGSCALLAATLTQAAAGPCTAEVESLSKVLSAQATGSGSSPSTQEYQANLSIGSDQAASGASASDDATVPPGRSRETTGSSMPMPSADPKPDRMASGTVDWQIAEAHSMTGAMNSLERARLFDQQGKETDCLRSVGMAKLISGFR